MTSTGRTGTLTEMSLIPHPDPSLQVFGALPAGVTPRLRRAAYAVIRDEQQHVATVRSRPTGEWRHWLPGGGREPDETAEQTILREIREELGRDARLTGIIGEVVQIFHWPRENCWYEMPVTLFRAEFEGPPLETREHELFWLDPVADAKLFFHACHAWAAAQKP